MALCINESGTYRNITTLCINQSGTYRNATTGCINQSGTYRRFGFPLSTALGSSFGGGFLICKPGSSPAWVVSPYSAEVSRTWYLRDDANTRSQAVSGCTGWFVPTVSQLQDPGYICKSFWGPSPCYSTNFQQDVYWSSTDASTPLPGHHGYRTHFACLMSFRYSNMAGGPKDQCQKVRAFRCVTY